MNEPDQLQAAVEALGGDYEFIRPLGQGATSVVYLLRDRALERDVAMKVIRASFAGDDEALARLQREARLVAQLTHPNIVKLFGTQRLKDGSFALFMEHVPGRNLKELLREEGAFSVPRTMRVLTDIGSALAYAHRRRIVHRDVKPENIYIDEEVGSARLADFGVARPWDQDARLTLPGASLGTPAYMSPEQIDGLEVDGRSDVYSLGLVGYELLLGHHPWEGENVFTIIYRQKNDELPIEVLKLEEYPGLAETLEKALEKNPSRRLESAVAFLDRLSQVEGVSLPPSSPALIRVGGADEDELLDPVDWGPVEPEEKEANRVSITSRDGSVEEREGSDLPILGAKPRWRSRPLLLALVAVVALSAYGLFAWKPWAAADMDPAEFRPISSPDPNQSPPAASGPERPSGAPVGLLPIQDSILSGQVGAPLALEVRAVGEGGSPLADTLVLFRVVDGDGVMETEEVRTDQDGLARGSLRLPNRPGDVMVMAQVSGADSLRTVLPATAHVGDPARVISILGDRQTANPGEALPELVGARVMDQFGNPVPGAEVRFQVLQGRGSITPSSTTTDDVGRAFARWTLGGSSGTQLVAAVVPGAEDALLTFEATATAPTPVQPDPEPTPSRAEPPGGIRTGPVTVIAKTFAVGGSQVCHLAGGSVLCRGANDRGQEGDRSLSGLVGMGMGVSHGCGLAVSGEAFCWGANESGQLGDGSTRDRQAPAGVETDARFSVVAGGLSHTCGLGAGGQAVCWGRNVNGQLGDGTREDHSRPVATSGDHSFLDLVAGWNHTCGLNSRGQAFCWGSNSAGQIGDGSQVDRLVPTEVPGTFQGLVAGASHTCGISGSQVLCWGGNDSGQLGDGTTQDRSTPTPVEGLPEGPIALAAGAVHTCALLSDRSTYCWGQNLHGQLGDGTNQNRSEPVPVSGDLRFVALYAGGGVTCAFSRDGAEYCWGLNQSGQLGDGTRTNRASPTRVGGSGL